MGTHLQDKFVELLTESGASEENAKLAWQELSELYQESGRYYHTLTHIAHMLAQMEAHIPAALHSAELKLSIWYHDVVYDPESKDNELNSAKICKETLEEITSLSSDGIDRIYTNIMSTKGHQVLATGILKKENQFMLDLDLSILGAEWERYLTYSEDIRKEYIAIPMADYKVGRSQVLKTFLQRKEIYFSEVFKNLYEEKARENLQKEIEILEK